MQRFCMTWSFRGAAASCMQVRESRKMILVIVFLSLLLDNILLTVVVPIIPEFLWSLEHTEDLDYYTEFLYNETLVNTTEYGGHFNYTPTVMSHITDFNTSVFDDVIVPPQHVMQHGGIHGNVLDTTAGEEYPRSSIVSAVTNENSEIGWLLSSKAIVQLVVNPFIGPITNRYGSSIPMFVGLVILCISNIMYAFGESYALLFVARSVQGVGSACIAIAGMTLIAIAYPDDSERSSAMGISLGGISLGVLIGYPYGGFMYQFLGKSLPFIILTVVTLAVAALQVWALRPAVKTKNFTQGTPLHILLCDPYILAASGAILFPEMAMAMLEPTLPLWLLDTMHAKRWQLGTIFLPDSIGYFIGTTVFAFVAHKIGRWICTAVALLLIGICLMCIPLATHLPHLIVPHFGLGLSLGMVDVAIMPMLAYLVDKRHIAAYGSVYAIAQVSISLGFALGPSLGGQIVRLIGFPWLIRGMAIANLIYCPVAYFLRDPPGQDENKSILMSGQPGSAYTDDEGNFGYQKLDEE